MFILSLCGFQDPVRLYRMRTASSSVPRATRPTAGKATWQSIWDTSVVISDLSPANCALSVPSRRFISRCTWSTDTLLHRWSTRGRVARIGGFSAERSFHHHYQRGGGCIDATAWWGGGSLISITSRAFGYVVIFFNLLLQCVHKDLYSYFDN